MTVILSVSQLKIFLCNSTEFIEMKKLYIVRHSKSPWKPGMDDFNRVLKKQGQLNTSFMAGKLLSRGAKIEHIISSSAVRTTETTQLLNEILNVPEQNITFSKELYLSPPETLLNHIHSVPDSVNELMVVAHNPGVSQLINFVANEHLQDVPTTGMACVTFDITSWKEIKNNGNLGFFIYPKMFK